MPLVKVIGPTQGTVATAAEYIELKKYGEDDKGSEPEPHWAPSVSPPQQEQAEQLGPSLEAKIQFWRKLAQRREEKDDAPEGVRIVRSAHASYIFMLHAHAIGYLIFAVTQWTLLYNIEELVGFVKIYYYMGLIPFVFGYAMLICLILFYKNLIKTRRKAMFYLYTAIMLQLATITIALPISYSMRSQLLFSSLITAIVIVISIVLAANRRDLYLDTPQHIIAWTFRCFIVSSVGIIIGLSVKSPHFDAVMTMILVFFMIIFILLCGKTLSRAEFIWLDKYGPHLYGSLFYLNYIILFSMCILLFEKLEEVQK